jgi:hypothetical protein
MEQEREMRRKQMEDRKKKVFEDNLKKEEMKSKIQDELDKRNKQKRLEFFSKRKNQMRKEFKNLSKQRKIDETEEEKIARIQMEKKEK